mgnify:CR=1 FL=1
MLRIPDHPFFEKMGIAIDLTINGEQIFHPGQDQRDLFILQQISQAPVQRTSIDQHVGHGPIDPQQIASARIEERHIHIAAADHHALTEANLPEANLLQESDFVPAVERGLAVGGATGVLAGVAAVVSGDEVQAQIDQLREQAAVQSMWFARNDLHVCDGGRPGRLQTMYLAIVDSATS